METAWKYWTHVRLEVSGALKRQEILVAKAFFQQQFPDLLEIDKLPDLLIQRQLVELRREASSERSQSSRFAEACLRCFVSQQILPICTNLERRFATRSQFSSRDLLPYVLDDVDPLQSYDDDPSASRFHHQPLAVKIVQSFDPKQSNLSTWTKRLVLQQKFLNAALAECGIYLVSDWAILSHTTPARLQRLLSDLLSSIEMQQACALLNSFHAIYRTDRMQRRMINLGQRCSEPDEAQLIRMVEYLAQQGISGYSPVRVLRELRNLAQMLRQGKSKTTLSLDDEQTRFLAESPRSPLALQQPAADPDDEQDTFLGHYRQQSEQCLMQAIQQAIDNRLVYLRSKKPPKDPVALPADQAFLKALRLFYCENQSMTEIAPQVGKQKQFQVTRLLKLDDLRADVRMTWLFLMVDKLDQMLQAYLSADQLQLLQQRIKRELWADICQKWLLMLGEQPDVLLKDYLNQGQFLLGELIDHILNQDVTSTYSKKSTIQPESQNLYAHCLCQYLHLLET